jgi:zinc protease
MAASSIADARALVGPEFAGGPLEVIVAGDITVDEAIRQTAATFGALPPRHDDPVAAAAAQVRFPSPGIERRTHKGRADQGLAFIAWPTLDFYSDTKESRTLTLLASVLQLRLLDEIREKQGTTYSPNAAHNPSEVFPGYGFLAAQIEAPPEKLDGFLTDAARIAADLRDKQIQPDELERARKPLIEGTIRQQASNEWWLNALSDVQTRPGAAQAVADTLAQYKAITAPELEQAARRFLVEGKAWKMEVLPSATASRQ